MKLYNILIKKNKNSQIEDVVVVADAFSFHCLIFSWLWFLYHKMWRNVLILVAVSIAFSVFEQLNIFPKLDLYLLEFSFLIIVAVNGNYWRLQHLAARGYESTGSIFSKNSDEAKIRSVETFGRAEFSEEIYQT
jgi:hypothetical protein